MQSGSTPSDSCNASVYLLSAPLSLCFAALKLLLANAALFLARLPCTRSCKHSSTDVSRLDAILEEAMLEALQRKRRALEAELERQMTEEEARMRAVHAQLAYG